MSISIWRLGAALPVFALFAFSGVAVLAQAPSPADHSMIGPAIEGLHPALDQVGAAIANLRIKRWKAPGDLRDSTEADVASIRQDMTVTLPPLLNQAQTSTSASGPLAPTFAVYRNIDALYDVLLRVTEMATLAGSSDEAGRLENARAALESARARLGNSLMESVTAQDAQLVHLQTEAAAAARTKAVAPPPTTIVVDDGPAPAAKPRKKKRPTTTPSH